MALEARAFSAPTRRTPIRSLPDTRLQRIFRWLLFIGTVALIVASLAGWVNIP